MHGAINEEACFTEGGLEPDFRLGAFEWSLWLDGDRRGGAAAAPGTPFASPLDEPLSFARDWQSLGETICRLIGITIGSSGTLASIAGGDAPPLTIQEIRWLRGVIFPGPRDALDVGSLAWGCDEIVAEVSQSLGRSSGRCTLLVPRTTAGLGDAVYDVTCGAVTKDDFKTQLTFVQADLDSGTTVYESPANADDNPHAYLVTARMVYTVRPYYSAISACLWNAPDAP